MQQRDVRDMNSLASSAKSASTFQAHVPSSNSLHSGLHMDSVSTSSGSFEHAGQISEEVSSSADSSDFSSNGPHGGRRHRRSAGAIDQKPPPGRDWGARFHKTALCTFHLKGRCNKGPACHFAHSEAELQPLPDLSGTKLCSRLVNMGHCSDPSCRYAHSRDELKVRPPWLARSARHTASLGSQPADTGSEGIPSTPSSLGEEEGDMHFLPLAGPLNHAAEPAPVMGAREEDIPSTPSSVGDEEGDAQFFPLAHFAVPPPPPPQPVMQLVFLAPAWQQVAPAEVTDFVVPAAPKKTSVRFEELPALAVKNTFITLEESPKAGLLRAKSMPDVFRSASDDEACEEEGSTEEPPSPQKSVGTPSTSFSFIDLPLDLPEETLAPIRAAQTQVVPVCAVQKVERLEEVVTTELEVQELTVCKPDTAQAPASLPESDPTPAEALAALRAGRRGRH